MAFSTQFDSLMERPTQLMREFAALLEPMDDARFAQLTEASAAVTRQHFGRTMRLFAPLYLSNECINNCAYCGFSRDNAIVRVTLEIDQVLNEARHLAKEGFRNILLVAGEHPKFVSNGYLELCVRRLAAEIPSVGLEIAPMEAADYRPLVAAGAESLIVYQETYHLETYRELHTAGPKKDFHWRLDCPERAYEAGFRRIGIGALYGLADWRWESLALAAHLEYLHRTCWRAQLAVSLPRMRPAAGGFSPKQWLPDREFIQVICALRLAFPHVGITLSTREPAELRDAIAPLGITLMSAGSHTEPGGYTGQGKENLHQTLRGKQVELAEPAEGATEQFGISDDRQPSEVAEVLRTLGLEPVWKDWDAAIING